MSYKIDLSEWKKVCELDNFILFKYRGFLSWGPFLELFEVMKHKKFTLRCIFKEKYFLFERVLKNGEE